MNNQYRYDSIMQTHIVSFLFFCAVLALVAGSCSPPSRYFTDEQIQTVTDRKEVMQFMATLADPGFQAAKAASAAPLTEEELLRFAEIGRRIPLAADRLVEPPLSKGPEFNKMAQELKSKAQALATATREKDATSIKAAALSLKSTCAACHREFR